MGNKRTKKDLEVRLEQINNKLVRFHKVKYVYQYWDNLYHIFAKNVHEPSSGCGSRVFCGTLSEGIAFCDGVRDILNRL